MTKIIGIDLDEVLAELVDYCLYYHDYKICGKSINKEIIKDYYIHHMVEYDITLDEAINWFRKPMFDDVNLKIKPVLGAIEVLKKFKNNGYMLKIVTARVSELFGEYTQKWIEKHYPNIFEEIIYADHFTKNDVTKSELCKKHGISFMVEDNFDYALELAQNGITTYLIEKPWNKHIDIQHENIKRVTSWEEISI